MTNRKLKKYKSILTKINSLTDEREHLFEGQLCIPEKNKKQLADIETKLDVLAQELYEIYNPLDIQL